MSKVAVVFYSGSGNTEAMADVIVNALGADKIEAEAFGAAKVADYDAIAFGCPAMGDEVLEETIFQPMWDDVKTGLAGKKVALFGSYGWGDGQWMRDWEDRMKAAGAEIIGGEGLILQDTPDADGEAACAALGKEMAALA